MLSMRGIHWCLLAVLLLMAPVGCGSDESESKPVKPGSNVPVGGRTETVRVLEKERKGIPADQGQWMAEIGVDPDGKLAFTVAEVVAPPGNTNFRLTNPQAQGHNLTIEEVGAGHVNTPVVREGSRWVRVSLFAGKKFVFYCSIPGHREAGMEGTIVVDPRLSAEDLKPYQ